MGGSLHFCLNHVTKCRLKLKVWSLWLKSNKISLNGQSTSIELCLLACNVMQVFCGNNHLVGNAYLKIHWVVDKSNTVSFSSQDIGQNEVKSCSHSLDVNDFFSRNPMIEGSRVFCQKALISLSIAVHIYELVQSPTIYWYCSHSLVSPGLISQKLSHPELLHLFL